MISAPEMVQPSDVEELKTEEDVSGYYAGVIESVAAAEGAPVEQAQAQADPVDYESMNRDDLAALAEKRSLRVTKRMNRQTLLTLLRESDKNTSVPSEQVDGGSSAAAGAPLDGAEDIGTEAAI